MLAASVVVEDVVVERVADADVEVVVSSLP